jgi:hypothetical protein
VSVVSLVSKFTTVFGSEAAAVIITPKFELGVVSQPCTNGVMSTATQVSGVVIATVF